MNDLDRDALLARMRDHIHTVVGRYKGRIKGWDVVNEALNEDGTLRLSPWMKIIGEDYIAKAFEYAHEADPAAELYYNDYSLENPAKRNGCIALVKKLQAQGVKLTAIGTQQHLNLEWPAIKLVDDTERADAGRGDHALRFSARGRMIGVRGDAGGGARDRWRWAPWP